ncbi:proprotein convertase subtilisin/kexin type 7-like [Mya arenaria]|uniref:proprotein convertase subtilisin/kexin type 7-like n=1 Tax=Mya arenaria TaxID=6604 RepID=UPI0022E5E6E9|nr:proprotein convertase subtilisin/kexin type 7-like [Mya arenaria]
MKIGTKKNFKGQITATVQYGSGFLVLTSNRHETETRKRQILIYCFHQHFNIITLKRSCCKLFLKITLIVLTSTAIVLLILIGKDGVTVDRQKILKKYIHPSHSHSNSSLIWIVKIIPQGSLVNDVSYANKIAGDLNMTNIGQVPFFDNHFTFIHKLDNSSHANRSIKSIHYNHIKVWSEDNMQYLINTIEKSLEYHAGIAWYSHQRILQRRKRLIKPSYDFLDFGDPYYKLQWHLTNTWEVGLDINVTGVWRHNVTGEGVTVAVVDDGIEHTNPDLVTNYNREGSYDLNDDDPDPMPDFSHESNHHGTRCAGEISAVPNNFCGVGVSYGAQFSGIRLLDGPLTDSLEAQAFTQGFQINDIYSCSWGPDDDGKTVDGPHTLAAAGMKKGIDFGRHGYGSIYVVASGNGGYEGDNCNYDGYANSLYTVTIGAIDETGHMPFYAEECASMLAVTFSSANGGTNRDIVTTDWTSGRGASRTGCTEHHTGTSAAAPIAAGLIALMLEVQPCLTWRDIQYLIALTAEKVDIDVAHWQKNAAGLWHSHKHGFGLMNAWRLTNAATVWNQVPWQTSFSYAQKHVNLPITKGNHHPLRLSYNVTAKDVASFDLNLLETVYVTVTIQHPRRGHLDIRLISPHGTESVIGATRHKDNSSGGFDNWTFSTVRCWGETPVGTWTLIIMDTDSSDNYSQGKLESWTLKLFGTPMTPKQLKDRKRSIEKAMHGGNLRKSMSCSPPPVTARPDTSLSVKTLKVLTVISCFCFLMAIYETFEYIFCYDKEKAEQSRTLTLLKRAHQIAARHLYGDSSPGDSQEAIGLLSGESIQLDTFQSINSSDIIPINSTNIIETDIDLGENLSNSANGQHSREPLSNIGNGIDLQDEGQIHAK